jgi:hypothetical protein
VANPLDVFVMADVVLPFPVNRIVRWKDVCPGIVDRMVARGVILTGGTAAAKAYPDIFPNGADAARKALKRAQLPDISLRKYIHRCPVIRPS